MIRKLFKKIFGVPNVPFSLPMRMFSDNPDDEYCWEDWKRDAKAKYPFRYFMSRTLTHWFKVKITMNIEHWWYWLRTHTYNRYHILDLRDPKRGYEWGWRDVDHKILMANFKLLREFVELEEPFKHIDWDADDNHAEAAKEIRALYQWWMEEYPKHWEDVRLDREAMIEKENDMLIRLIKLRGHLWT